MLYEYDDLTETQKANVNIIFYLGNPRGFKYRLSSDGIVLSRKPIQGCDIKSTSFQLKRFVNSL